MRLTPPRTRPPLAARAASWIAAAALSVSAATTAPSPSPAPPAPDVLELSRGIRVRLEGSRGLAVEVLAGPGETWEAIARRAARGPQDAAAIAAGSRAAAPAPGAFVRIPFDHVAPEWREMVLRNVFPKDRREGGDWIHVARAGALPAYDEGLWQVAAWFCGDGARFEDLRAANGLATPELRPGQEIRIPAALLDPALRAASTSDDGSLVFGKDAEGDYAGYRLRAGEALYSAVVLRFTEITSQEDVESAVRALAKRSGVADVTDIPVGFLVKIPRDLLESSFLPKEDPRRKEREAARAALAAELESRPPPEARDRLQGVVVIVDPGHGGQDLGTIHNGLWEHDYVYDVACRLKRRLERDTAAKVYLTLVDQGTGTAPSTRDDLPANRQGTLQTHPPFLAQEDGDTSVGVNLRWYLANSIYRAATRKGVHPDRVVFLSLHADARHPSLRGAMVYVPGSDYRKGTYGFRSDRYLRFKEVREKPTVSFSSRERLRSEAVSRSLAARIVRTLLRADLPVQQPEPVRGRVIRGGSTWLPAVLRGNAVPTKVLVEMLNLSNEDDARLLGRAADRERLAGALVDSLVAYFRKEPVKGGVASSR